MRNAVMIVSRLSYTICQAIDSPLSTSISPSFFHSRLKTFLSTNPSHRNLPFLLHGLGPTRTVYRYF